MLFFLGMLMGIIEGARMVGSYFALANAAAEGARIGAVVPAPGNTVSTIDDNIRARVRTTMQPWISLPDSSITICRRLTIAASCDAAGTSTVVSNSNAGRSVIDITITYSFQFLLFVGGFLQQTSVPMTGFDRARID